MHTPMLKATRIQIQCTVMSLSPSFGVGRAIAYPALVIELKQILTLDPCSPIYLWHHPLFLIWFWLTGTPYTDTCAALSLQKERGCALVCRDRAACPVLRADIHKT